MVEDGAFCHKLDYVTIFKRHQNCITGSKVTAILLNEWILPIGGASDVNGLRLQPAQQACFYKHMLVSQDGSNVDLVLLYTTSASSGFC